MNDETQYPPSPMSQDHIANEFAKSIAGKWCYVHDYGRWFYHDGKEWKMDRVDEIKEIVRLFCREAVHWPKASSLSASKKGNFSSSSYLSNVLHLTKCDRLIAKTSEKIGLPLKKKNDRGRYP